MWGELVLMLLLILFAIIIIAGIVYAASGLSSTAEPAGDSVTSLFVSKDDLNAMALLLERLSRFNFPFWLMGSVLLGSVVYQDQVPWERHITIAILEIDLPRFLELDFKREGLIVHRQSKFGYLIYNDDSSTKDEQTPSIQVLIYQNREGELTLLTEPAPNEHPHGRIAEHEVFPLVACRYRHLSVPCPRSPDTILNRVFPKWKTHIDIDRAHSSQLTETYSFAITPTLKRQVESYLRS